MDPLLLRRLDCLSKKQLLAALNAVTEGCDAESSTVRSLRNFLDSLPAPPGSSRPTQSTGEAGSTAEPAKSVDPATEPATNDKSASERFNIAKYRTRQVALHIQYDGTAYLGFASQDLEETVENHLFNALTKLKLIEDRKTCNYSRCGRTDKGVSALGQVVALSLRSAVPRDLPDELMPALAHPADKIVIPAPAPAASAVQEGEQGVPAEGDGKAGKRAKGKNANGAPVVPKDKVVQEMDYVTMLNRSLPDDIRVLGWCPVTEAFSARFSAAHRAYRYFFQRKRLDIPAMRAAAAHLLGEHDFRNICKMDIANVSNFRREIYSAEIRPFQPALGPGAGAASAEENEDTIYMLEIRGIAFLWHMVRCIMAVLFMVGEGQEEPAVVLRLLDVETCKGKPPYPLADERPLVLHECGFDNLRVPLQPRHLWQLTAHYRGILEGHLIAAARARNSLELVMNSEIRRKDLDEFLESLRQQDERHAKKREKSKAAATSAGDSAGIMEVVGDKRKLDALLGAEKEGAVVTSDQPVAQGSLVWGAVLRELEEDMGHTPRVKYVPHVPLMERRREDTYEEKISNLAGSKKERLDRHVSLSSSAAASGATPQFFQKMRQQGSIV